MDRYGIFRIAIAGGRRGLKKELDKLRDWLFICNPDSCSECKGTIERAELLELNDDCLSCL
jgi:hypothetical protein